MSRAAVTLGYLNWLLQAFAIGFGAWLGVSALSRFDRLAERQQVEPEAVSVAPSPEVSPSPVLSPSPSPIALSPMAIEVSRWEFGIRWKWIEFCGETNGGLGYGAQEQEICRALSEVDR